MCYLPPPKRPELSRDRRNVYLAARSLSPPACEVAVISGLPKNHRTKPLSWHRRRNVRSPAATDRALRELARVKGSPCARLLPATSPEMSREPISFIMRPFWLVTAQKRGGMSEDAASLCEILDNYRITVGEYCMVADVLFRIV